MNQLVKFDTASVAPANRLTAWNDLLGETYPGTFANAEQPDLRATLWRWSVGELEMIRPRSQRAQVRRVPDPRVTEERVILHLQRRGTCHHRQWSREAELRAGDFSLCSANDPYALDFGTVHELLAVEFPRALLTGRVSDLDDRFGKKVSGAMPCARLFHDFLLSLWLQGEQGSVGSEWQSGISSVFADLLALTMNGSDIARDSGPGSELRTKLLALVEARLGDPELRTATIAEELHVSDRTVQHAFAAMGTTPCAYILKRRLTRGAEMLNANADTTITAVAFDLGFNDSAYFARCFRSQFGVAPRAWRGDNAQ